MSKAKGSRIERKARRLLEATGHEVVRAGASLGVWDLLAWQPNGHLRAIQVKGGQHPYAAPAEVEAMKLAALPAAATRELWRWTDYARAPEIEVL